MYLSNNGAGTKVPEPFRTHAGKYLDVDLSIFPVRGKKPLVNWKKWQSKIVGTNTFNRWLAIHPAANIGIATGELSGITVVDSDNPNTTPIELFAIYGETPLVIQTPGGGYHLYYRHNGEGCKRIADKRIDIKGQGGLVVAPESVNSQTGKRYRYYIGDIMEFENLPLMIPQAEAYQCFTNGERNTALYNYLRAEAINCPTVEELRNTADNYNNRNLTPPLDDTEVQKVIKSVWGYKEAGRLFQAGKQSIVLEIDKIKDWMCKYPPALALYVDLKRCHFRSNKTFAIASKGYDKRLGWSDKKVAKARDVLLQYSVIECVHKGGKYKGDVSLYILM